MSRLKVYLPSNCLKLHYNSYILSVMDYCCTVWGNATSTRIDKLYKLQKRAARIILNATMETPSTVMFKKLEWLTIYNRINYFRAVMMYKCMNGLAPEYLTEFFHKCSSVNNYTLRSATINNLHVQRPNANFEKRTFRYSGIVLNATMETPSAVMFKKLEWLTIYNSIYYFRAVMMYNCMNRLAPEYLIEFFHKCSSVNLSYFR